MNIDMINEQHIAWLMSNVSHP